MADRECWVTSATDDNEAWKALVLARSIRNSMTTRTIIVAISEHVSNEMRTLLRRVFENVLLYESSEVGNKRHRLLWLWNIQYWTKCVYVHPMSYMLENADELFSYPPFSTRVECTADGGMKISSKIIIFKPNLQDFDQLVELSESNLQGTFEDILESKFSDALRDLKHQVVASHASKLFKMENGTWYGSVSPKSAYEEVMQNWMTTFETEVIPQVLQLKNDRTREQLLHSARKHYFTPTVNGHSKVSYTETKDAQDLEMGIAVVGMSCRFPEVNDADELWELLMSGRDPIGPFPPDRPRPLNDDTENFKAGFLKCAVDEFDANFFGISPREAPFIDPQQRFLLEVVWECLENAAINPVDLRGTNTGVFVGITGQDYLSLFPKYGLDGIDYNHVYVGNAFSATAARVSHCLGLRGPNIAVESGCSSSASAVHLACQSLQKGESELAIVAGVNLILDCLSPLGGGRLLDSLVFAKDFKCKTFDESADGYVRAEGCAAIVLRRLEGTTRANDNVVGIIRGTALNNNGAEESFGAPNCTALELAFREALNGAGVKPSSVSLVETHGTGTAVGDPIEMSAVEHVYSEGRSATNPLLVTSVKTNIGHSEACAGLAGLIKVLLCFKHKQVPPNRHFQKLNPKINLQKIPALIPIETTEWKAKTRVAAVCSYGMSGTNVHIILQEPPLNKNFTEFKDQAQMIGISAKSEAALEALCQKYISYFEKNPKLALGDIALTLNTGRANFPHRIALVAKNTKQLIEKLKQKAYIKGKTLVQKPKLIFLFTGQGSQYFGMAKTIYQHSPVFRTALEQCETLFKKHLTCSLKEVVWGDAALLEKTIYCQPAIFSVQFALVQLWHSFGIYPDIVLGHSVGEFCASVCAGVLSLEDGMKLVAGRSKLLNSIEGGKMMVVKTSPENLRSLIPKFLESNFNSYIDIAAENSDEEVVVSGTDTNMLEFASFCEQHGLKVQMILASHAFHSRQMESILPDYEMETATIRQQKLKCRYISGTLARELKQEEFNSCYWSQHLRNTVTFRDAIDVASNLFAEDRKVFVEIGTKPTLLSMAMANLPNSTNDVFCPSLRPNEDDLASVLNSLSKMYVAGVEVSWKNWCCDENTKLNLPTYPFQRQKFWFQRDQIDFVELPRQLGSHPTLGRRLPTGGLEIIFDKILSPKILPYAQDYCIAESVILLGAVYCETILAAGRHVLQNKDAPVQFSVQNFVIEAQLELDKSVHMQTIAKAIEGGDKLDVAIHKQCREDCDTWKRLATGIFTLNCSQPNISCLDVNSLQQKLDVVESMTKVYDQLAAVGYQFGHTFRSISSAWVGEHTLLASIEIPQDCGTYVCHPIVLDAMIQTVIIYSTLKTLQGSDKLQLLTQVKKFTWYSEELSPKVFAYLTNFQGSNHVTLVNNFGRTLALMEGVEFIQMSISTFLEKLNPKPPSLKSGLHFEEVWRPRDGVTRNRVDVQTFKIKSSCFTKSTLQSISQIEDITLQSIQIIDKLFVLFLLKGIRESAWPWPKVGQKLLISDWGNIATDLQVVKSGKVMEILEVFLFLKELEYGKYQVLQELPSLEVLEKQIFDGFEQHAKLNNGKETVIEQFTRRCGKHLSSVLQGKLTPVSFLFPEDSLEVGAFKFYSDGEGFKENSMLTTSVLVDCTCGSSRPNGVLRILEVGAGSGISCGLLLDKFAQLNVSVKYTLTDISTYFLDEAKKKFTQGVSFAQFNIEQDPLSQGFAPEEFDVIIAINVVHATADISQTLRNLNLVLRQGGMLLLGEMFVDFTFINLSFGFLDGWWRSTDARIGSPLLTQDQWKSAFETNGFAQTHTFSCFDGTSGVIAGIKGVGPFEINPPPIAYTREIPWLVETDGTMLASTITTKLTAFGRSPIQYDRKQSVQNGLEGVLFFVTDEVKTQGAMQEVLGLVKKLDSAYQMHKLKPKLIFVTRGVNYLSDAGPGNPNAATITSFIRSFANEHTDFKMMLIDLDQDEINFEREAEEIFALLWSQENEMFQAIRQDHVFVQRLVCGDNVKHTLSFPNSTRFCIMKPVTKNLDDLDISLAPNIPPVEDEVEVAVRATGLNFKDLVLILQPDGFLDPYNTQPGFEVAGVVSATGPSCTKFKIGDPVYGVVRGNGLGSHVTVSSRYLIRKPDQITFTSAASVPTAFITALYGLKYLANLSDKERVLIHTATGGVGLAAIQVAKHLNAEVFATAGSRREKAYLKSIGVQYVYSSKTTDFGHEILKDTNGQGVDVVLNSLTAPGFKEASLQACAQNGRFIEIGKVNTWREVEVKRLRSDVKYYIPMLGWTTEEGKENMSQIMGEIGNALETGQFKTLPHQAFSVDRIREAYLFFQQAKHIGKIVITIPEAKVSPSGKIEFEQQLFNHESTYLITGGLGGIGIEVAKWMKQRGATNLVLVGRNKPSIAAEDVLKMLNKGGCRTLAVQANVGIYEEVKSLLKSLNDLKFPPLRGIMHAAGVLSDGAIVNQSWEKFEKVFQPKVNGTWNLHNLTLGYDMEFFILFSSMVSNFGSPGLSNHAAANRFLDSFAHHRHSLGLPACSINFGPWSEVGVALVSDLVRERTGIRALSVKQGLAALKTAMEEHKLQFTVLNVSDWAKVKRSVYLGNYLHEIDSDDSVSKKPSSGKKLIRKEIEEAKEQIQRRKIIEEFVHSVLKETIHVGAYEELDPDKQFSEFGVDSLMTIEMRNRLQIMFKNSQLTVSSIQESRTIRKLTNHLENLMHSDVSLEQNERD